MSEFILPEKLKSSKTFHTQRIRLATSIGLLVMTFNKLDHDIGEYLATFLKKDSNEDYFNNIGIMSASLSFSQKLDLLSALYLKRYEKKRRQSKIFKKIIRNLSEFEEYRNRQLHSRWGTKFFGDADIKRFKPTIKGRKGLHETEELVPWREIRKKCDEMDHFSRTLFFQIFRGCTRYEEMSEETLLKLEKLLNIHN